MVPRKQTHSPMTALPDIAFLDFEASSLGKYGYPIEVAWVLGDGEEESHLIRPAPGWGDWDIEAEAVHGISRERLEEEGEPVEDVARRMLSVLSGRALYATAPSWDGKWLSRLLRGAGLPRHALRIQDTEAAHTLAMREELQAAGIPEDFHADIMQAILSAAQRRDSEIGPAVHRALADARREQRLWRDIRRLARETAEERRQVLPDR